MTELQWIGAVALAVFVFLFLVFGVPLVRRNLITRFALPIFKKVLPPVSDTERAALDSGTVGFEGELFSGRPDIKTLRSTPSAPLSAEEQAFLRNEVTTLCGMLDDWRIFQDKDLPPEVWTYLREHRFFGMIIPKEYGGLGFSAAAHAAVVTRLASRSTTVAVTVMVPNSLGPAELLLHYGTDEQKRHYLPRLASGEEIPCFSLTGPTAGSDAGSIPDAGRVVREDWSGVPTLGFRVNWSKRYITLGPISTVIGLAFQVKDPDGLLGPNKEPGITCALIPVGQKGIRIGSRHQPMDSSFMNGPNWGDDVFVPLDWVIGGREQVGQGWKMLMESLAAGRAISLPSLGVSMQMLTVRTVGAYAALRRQFGLPIHLFHGVAEPLGRMTARLYAQDGARRIAYAEIEHGGRPAVASAILKYHLTEGARTAVNEGMDILGGKGLCVGPRNFLARIYTCAPIGITVEGANILTRNLILFGQGAIRCHRFVRTEMGAAADNDLVKFDAALFAHIRAVLANALRAIGLLPTPDLGNGDGDRGRLAPSWRQLARLSARFALASDFAMLTLGGKLKRLELQSARLGDVLSNMYLATGALLRWEHDGCHKDDQPLAELAAQDALHKAYVALGAFFDNAPLVLRLLRPLVMPTGVAVRAPTDDQWLAAAAVVTAPGLLRDRLTSEVYRPEKLVPSEPVAQLDRALMLTQQLTEVDRALKDLTKKSPSEDAAEKSQAAYLDKLPSAQRAAYDEREKLVEDIIAVDVFEKEDLAVTMPRI